MGPSMMLATSPKSSTSVQYGDHSERSTFHVTGIGRMTIILGHTWLVEHNPKIDWSTGKVCMNRCLAACAPNITTDDTNQPSIGFADNSADHSASPPRAKSCKKVHIEEVPEGRTEPNKTGLPPGFACPDPDNLDQGNRLFVCFIGEHLEEFKVTQMISQKLAEAAGGTRSMRFEDIVPEPYQEFKDVFAKESFDELLDWKKW